MSAGCVNIYNWLHRGQATRVIKMKFVFGVLRARAIEDEPDNPVAEGRGESVIDALWDLDDKLVKP